MPAPKRIFQFKFYMNFLKSFWVFLIFFFLQGPPHQIDCSSTCAFILFVNAVVSVSLRVFIDLTWTRRKEACGYLSEEPAEFCLQLFQWEGSRVAHPNCPCPSPPASVTCRGCWWTRFLLYGLSSCQLSGSKPRRTLSYQSSVAGSNDKNRVEYSRTTTRK